jgi:hypothetical protein
VNVKTDPQSRPNAAQLDQALAQTPVDLAGFEEVELQPFSFKLEFADGTWTIFEKELVAKPQFGDIVSFEGSGSWRIQASQLVRARPSQKPVREFFVCAPVV